MGLVVGLVAAGLLVDGVVEGVVAVVEVECKEAEDVNVSEAVERDVDDCEELVFVVEVAATGVDVAEVVLAVVV